MPPSRVSPDVAASNANAIQRMFDVGRDSLQHMPGEADYGAMAAALVSERKRLETKYGAKLPIKLGKDSLPKVRRIAGDYTEDQIREIVRLVKDYRSSFSTSHMIRLLAVKQPEKRWRLMLRAIEASWSTKTLVEEIQGYSKRRRQHVGRHPSVPRTKPAFLTALHRRIETWHKWNRAARHLMPDDVRRRLDAIDTKLQSLKEDLDLAK